MSKSKSCNRIPENQIGSMILRGVAGIGLLAWSVTLMASSPMLALAMMGISVWLLKGCPACWGMHMVNVVRNNVKGRKKAAGPEEDLRSARPKRAYQPRDMSAHLFPPADVARFREMSNGGANAGYSDEEKTQL